MKASDILNKEQIKKKIEEAAKFSWHLFEKDGHLFCKDKCLHCNKEYIRSVIIYSKDSINIPSMCIECESKLNKVYAEGFYESRAMKEL
jgi:hypothetical protein